LVELTATPCDFDRHLQGGHCDCLLCGWHVWDVETLRDASGKVVIDGTTCLNGRPRADRYAR